MPESETPFDSDHASPELKQAAASAAQEGRLAAEARRRGLEDNHEETMEEIAARAEAELSASPASADYDAEDEVRVRMAADAIREQQQAGAQAVGEAERLINQAPPEHRDQSPGESFHSFAEAALAISQEKGTDIEVDPALPMLEDIAQRQFLAVDSHLMLARDNPNVSAQAQHYMEQVQSYRHALSEQLDNQRRAFVEGYRLGDSGQGQRVQAAAVENLRHATQELDKIIGFLKGVNGTSGERRY